MRKILLLLAACSLLFLLAPREKDAEPLVTTAACALPALSTALWPPPAPKAPPKAAPLPPSAAAIVYLVDLARPERVAELRESLRALQRHFFAAAGRAAYPVLLFYEPAHARWVAERGAGAAAPLAAPPRFVAVEGFYGGGAAASDGYRRMCRFWAMGVFRQPAVRALRYFWRLDTDLRLLRPIALDPFRLMEARALDYLFGAWSREAPEVVVGLWDALRAFAAARNLSTAGLAPYAAAFGAADGTAEGAAEGGGYNLRMVYNNFEVVRVALWRDSAAYAALCAEALEAGIRRRRWGDAPIRTLALALLFPDARVAQWRGLCYHHAAPQWTL